MSNGDRVIECESVKFCLNGDVSDVWQQRGREVVGAARPLEKVTEIAEED